MGARTITGITAAGIIGDPKFGGLPYFVSPLQNTDLFIGVSGSFTSVTLQMQGARADQTRAGANGTGPWYDIGSYTTDGIGPLATPLSASGGVATAWVGDVRAFNFYQITILSLSLNAGASLTVEVADEGFFPARASLASGPMNQLVYELRYQNSILTGWLGLPNGPLPALNPSLIGPGVGGTLTNGA